MTDASKKMRFKPKVPSHRPPKPIVPKKEVLDDDDAEAAEREELFRRMNEERVAGKPKIERKEASVRVAFGAGASNMPSFYNPFKDSINSKIKDDPGFADFKQKEYTEPWNYEGEYPQILPLRRPYSGNPEVLDEKEFGHPSNMTHMDERRGNAAEELGLMDDSPQPKLMFFQLPKAFPMTRPVNDEPGTSTVNPNTNPNTNPSRPGGPTERICGLRDMQSGLMGKMLVYKSGKVKLKLGDTLFDVSPGSKCMFAQDVVAINTKEKHCCVVGDLNCRAIVTPDVDSILSRLNDSHLG